MGRAAASVTAQACAGPGDSVTDKSAHCRSASSKATQAGLPSKKTAPRQTLNRSSGGQARIACAIIACDLFPQFAQPFARIVNSSTQLPYALQISNTAWTEWCLCALPTVPVSRLSWPVLALPVAVHVFCLKGQNPALYQRKLRAPERPQKVRCCAEAGSDAYATTCFNQPLRPLRNMFCFILTDRQITQQIDEVDNMSACDIFSSATAPSAMPRAIPRHSCDERRGEMTDGTVRACAKGGAGKPLGAKDDAAPSLANLDQ